MYWEGGREWDGYREVDRGIEKGSMWVEEMGLWITEYMG